MEERATLEHPDKKIKETTPLNLIELLLQKFTLQRQLAKHIRFTETNKKSYLTWGEKKIT